MPGGPSKIVEAIVSLLVPPACREEIVGDLHERFESSLQYVVDALNTVPLVVASRMRRVTDPQVLLTQICALYISFLGAAWFESNWVQNGIFLRERWSFSRLAIPVAMAVIGLVLDDTYANPMRQPSLNVVRAPLLGLVLALASQELLRIDTTGVAIPRWILLYGCAAGSLLSSGIRMLFPPLTGTFLSVKAPAGWLKREAKSGRKSAVVLILLLVLLLVYQIYRPA